MARERVQAKKKLLQGLRDYQRSAIVREHYERFKPKPPAPAKAEAPPEKDPLEGLTDADFAALLGPSSSE